MHLILVKTDSVREFSLCQSWSFMNNLSIFWKTHCPLSAPNGKKSASHIRRTNHCQLTLHSLPQQLSTKVCSVRAAGFKWRSSRSIDQISYYHPPDSSVGFLFHHIGGFKQSFSDSYNLLVNDGMAGSMHSGENHCPNHGCTNILNGGFKLLFCDSERLSV